MLIRLYSIGDNNFFMYVMTENLQDASDTFINKLALPPVVSTIKRRKLSLCLQHHAKNGHYQWFCRD